MRIIFAFWSNAIIVDDDNEIVVFALSLVIFNKVIAVGIVKDNR